ncbi:phosphatase PAP2 family protein [Spiroplasma alleghenense]|uniref:Phosphatidic acid phosphatase type 2/haloperoxidase domain-containing protein n=1 Tax=Spiroplasma alleghenense TaxID=216931 RepID=A0A345Z4K6_9MOLU|nr:phosphatase PAP2 family protein [Spiroplasma alleghenense]AXK51535.1 hypothetical protein SALLE_v1c08650 [Spiroplasma alleghenense]
MTKSIYKQWYIIVTLATAGVFLVAFLLTSFGNIDRWFADVMGEWIQVDFIKFWVVFYNEMGFTSLFLVCSISVAILIETFYSRHDQKSKFYKTIFGCYSLLIAFFLYYNLDRLVGVVNENTGWGPGIDVEYLTNNNFKIASRISIFVIESIILIISIYLLRFKISKSKILVENRAWVIALSSIFFGMICYFTINYVLKQTFGRPYYLNVEFERYIGKVNLDENGWAVDIDLTPEAQKLELDHPDLKEQILESYNTGGYWTQADGYYKWYEINGNWYQNLKYWTNLKWLTWWMKFDPNYVKPAAWANGDFPSGHTISGYTGIYYVLFASTLIKDDKKRHITVNTLFIIWFINEMIMVNILVVARTHYISDTWFSFVFCTAILILTLRLTNTLSTKVILKVRNKKSLENQFTLINNNIYVYFQNENQIKISNNTKKSFDKKIKKYLREEQIKDLKLKQTSI